MEFDGLLLVDKPSGWSSFDVVAKIRGTIKRETGRKVKVGHTGTLDPLATGLMIVVLGSYCKRAEEFTKLDKTYDTVMRLGETSSTDDGEGEKTPVSDHRPEKDDIISALGAFIGEIEQVPPAHSAIKVDGKRAYKLARAGKEVVMKPRKARINSISFKAYDYPDVEFTADVGSGTYIRSLVRDLGSKLGTGAYMSGLRRIRTGKYSVENASRPIDLNSAESIISRILL